jgi:hypothetical protein
MKVDMRLSAAFLCFMIALASAPAAAQAQSLVYRVDRATAVVDGPYLILRVKGAVRTGGWEHPRLVVRHGPGDRNDLEVHFMATPPSDASVVVQSVLPMNVSLKTRAPSKTVGAVKIVSETNTVTTQIIAKDHPQRTAQQ